MKKFIAIALLSVASLTAFAEASFDQIESLIQQKNYAAAEAGLEGIIKNHPNSAKAFYAMAQAQAGLGNLEKAQKALNIATGLNPTLDFAPEGSVQKLKQAITPQTKEIVAIEESHALRNFVVFVMFAGFAVACYFMYSVYARRQEEEAKEKAETEARWAKEMDEAQARHDKFKEERAASQQAEDALKAHKNYGHERFDPTNPDKLKTVKQFKAEQAAREAQLKAELAEAKANEQAALARGRESYARMSSTPSTTVVNNSNDGLLTGILIGDMMNHHHDTTRVVEREVIREVPAPSYSSRSSSWDDDSSSRSSSRSSSWDSDSSSSSSSSWSSSSSSDSSWSSSSSSDSSSSSSWD